MNPDDDLAEIDTTPEQLMQYLEEGEPAVCERCGHVRGVSETASSTNP